MQGIRGLAGSPRAINYGMNKANYFPRANRDTLVIVAIETPLGAATLRKSPPWMG